MGENKMKILLVLLSIISFAANAQPKWVEGRILVSPKAGLPAAKFAEIIKGHGARGAKKIGQSNLYIVETLHGSERSIVARLKNNPHFRFAELDMIVEPGFAVNDPYYANAWHLPKIDAPTAWDTTQGSGVVVAILDSGVDPNHPDLSPQLVPGWNFYSNNADTSDVYGHGTKVAGTLAAVANNAVGVAGVAGQARIMPIRVSGADGMGSWSAISSGLIYAADHGAKVANASFLGLTDSASTRSAAQYMKDKGGLVIVGGGNTAVLQTYAVTTSMIAVAATDANDGRASWSSYGNYISLSAPGAGIWTTTMGGGYGSVSGTSFSSPVTAGVVALMMAAAPGLPNTQIEKILFQTAVDAGDIGWDQYYGWGRVDAGKAVSTAYSSSPIVIPPAVSVSITSPQAGSTVSGLVNVDTKVDGMVSRVDLMVNRTVVASDTASPYSFVWDSTGALNGTNTLTAKTYDANGVSISSDPVTVNVSNATGGPTFDTTPPTVTIVNPVAGQVSGNVTITVNASDDSPASGLTLQIYVDGALIASGSGSTLSSSWNTKPKKVASGSHEIKAVARDLAGNASSMTVTVIK
jgi:subtilisin family serine protease